MDEKLVLPMRSEVGGGIECLGCFCVTLVLVFVFRLAGEKGGTFPSRCGNIGYSTAIVPNFQVNQSALMAL